jgi:hypothetical protein
LSDPLFELFVSGFENEKEIVHVRPRIVRSLVPALGTLLQRLVVAFFVLFDEPLQTDVAAYLIAQMIALKK